MTHEGDKDTAPAPKSSGTGGIGCLLGVATAVAIPVVVFCSILIANRMNPQYGAPGDSGGCEMGLAVGTIGGIVIGLVLGVIIAIVITIAGRAGRPPEGPK
jgi:hypothetical protein